jgi:4'-phosphopantetheinyl transferase
MRLLIQSYPGAGPSELVPNTVHIWWIALDKPVSATVAAILSADERARADRFHFPIHRDSYIAARSAMRSILSSYTGIEPERIRFGYGSNGKPFLEAELCNDLRFNLSHSQTKAMLGVTRGREIGVDVEMIRPVDELLQIAEQFFCRTEIDMLRHRIDSERLARFFALWTCKEAVIKTTGQGLSQPLNRVDVSQIVDDSENWLMLDDGSTFYVQQLSAPSGYMAAFAVEGTDSSEAAN